MIAARVPEEEEERLVALRELELLDTPAQPEFDELVALAAKISGAKIALISLIDRERQWFKAKLGLTVSETPRAWAFCAHAILQDGLFVIPDATADPRFADNPLVVGDPWIRFYAGAVLTTEAGQRMGTLCVIDDAPRELSPELRGALSALGHAASSLLELHRRRTRERALIREQSRIARDLQRTSALLRRVSEAQRDFLIGRPQDAVFRALLDALVVASESELGFIGEVVPDEGGPRLHWHATSPTILAGDGDDRFDGALADLVATVVRGGAPVIVNAIASDPGRVDGPTTGPRLRAFLGMPCRADGEVIGLIAVANRDAGYATREVEELGVLRATCAAIFANLRLQRQNRAAEDERRRSDDRLRAIIDSANDAIVCFDRAGTIRTWNPEATRIFGWSEDEALGRDVLDLIVPAEQRARRAAQIARAIDDDERRLPGHPFELEGRRRDGSPVPLDVSLARMSIGRERVLSAFLRDASARKESEVEIQTRSAELARVNAELAEALRIKDEFLATVSHELRTPLQAVIGRTALLLGGHYGALSPAQSEALRAVGGSGELLLRLINDLLDLTKIEADQLVLSPGDADVGALIDDCIAQIREAAERKSLAIVRTIDPSIPRLCLDALRFQQMMINILSNAVKFTASGSIVVHAALTAGGDRLEIEVRDTGIGIPADQLEIIFEPFTQVDRGPRRQHTGTGLGLALTRRLVDLFGGQVGVASVLGEGTTFTLTLPAQASEATADDLEEAPIDGAPARPIRVLLAEDNEINVLTITAFLEAAGHEVRVARDGAEAIEMVETLRPELVLMDLHMPVIDGIEAALRIRANPTLGRLPIIALTAMGRAAERERCRGAGFDAFLTKPVTPRRLAEVIAALVPSEP